MIEYITLDQQVKKLYKDEGKQEGKQEVRQEIIKLIENNKDKTVKEILDIIRNSSNAEPVSQPTTS